MNKIHRIVWNHARQTYVVASEHAATRGKPSSTVKRVASALAGALIAQAAYAAPAPDALPTGGQVVSGSATIAQTGANMTINQASDKAILNWNRFNIGSGASVNFQQPSASAVALNRVVGADPSAIYGSLTANGQVYLVNPNGVLFGQGARVNVGGLVASTLAIRNEDFLAGSNRFTRDGATAGVTNQGELLGQYVALLAPEVRNEGVISATMGTAALAAGEAVTLGITGNQLIDVQVDRATIATLVENKHLVQAQGGTVVMSAQSANGLLGQVVNSGTIEAQGLANDGGVVRLLASSTVDHSGSINTDAGANGKGGSVILMGDLTNPGSQTNVSGSISAKGGSASGDGGFIETSGTHLKIADTAKIDTSAANGKNGQWLLDPVDFTIAQAGGDITGAALTTALQSSSVTIQTGASATCTGVAGCLAGTVGNGDILVQDSIGVINWTSANTLTLSAYRNIDVTNINANIDASAGAGNIVLNADNTGIGTGTVVWDSVNGPNRVANGSGTVSIYYNPTSYAAPTDFVADLNNNVGGLVSKGTGAVNQYMRAYINNASATAQNRVYDGTTTATLNTPFTLLTTAAGAPTATLNAGTATFADKNAGTGKAVTFAGYTVSGSVAIGATGRVANYALFAQPTGQTANISKAAITLTAATNTKTYDGTTAAAATPTVTAGALASGDSFTTRSETYASKNAGTGLTLTPSVVINDGNNGNNYQLTLVNDTTGVINKAPLTVKANDATQTTGAPAYTGGNGVTYTGFVNGETAAVLAGALTYGGTAQGAKDAGTYTITPGGLASTNYAIQNTSGSLTITAQGIVWDTAKVLIAMVTAMGGGAAGGTVSGDLAAAFMRASTGEANDEKAASEYGNSQKAWHGLLHKLLTDDAYAAEQVAELNRKQGSQLTVATTRIDVLTQLNYAIKKVCGTCGVELTVDNVKAFFSVATWLSAGGKNLKSQ